MRVSAAPANRPPVRWSCHFPSAACRRWYGSHDCCTPQSPTAFAFAEFSDESGVTSWRFTAEQKALRFGKQSYHLLQRRDQKNGTNGAPAFSAVLDNQTEKKTEYFNIPDENEAALVSVPSDLSKKTTVPVCSLTKMALSAAEREAISNGVEGFAPFSALPAAMCKNRVAPAKPIPP